MERRGGAVGFVTGLAIPTLNGVICASSASAPDVTVLLDKVGGSAVPYALQSRSGLTGELVDLPTRFGMTRADDLPAMVLDRPPITAAGVDDGLTVRRLGHDEIDVHFGLLGEAFEAPVRLFAPMAGTLCRPGTRLYVGEVGGQPVTTGAAIDCNEAVGIFNVATPDRFRRRGYASAVTARAVLDGLSTGAARAYLQSSPMGLGVYLGLGFRTIETWQVWVTSG
jgi:hypothetical protein